MILRLLRPDTVFKIHWSRGRRHGLAYADGFLWEWRGWGPVEVWWKANW